MDDKSRYRSWSTTQPGIPVFSRPWWLDSTCGADWDVILTEHNGAITGALPFYRKKRGVFRLITKPPLTQTMGPYLVYAERLSPSDRLSFEKKTIGEMIGRLPRVDHFIIPCNFRLTNWLPFHWAGFNQTTAYTYIIPDLSDLDAVFARFDYAKRKDIKKAQKIVEVGFDLDASAFYENHRMTLAKQGASIIYSQDFFLRIYDAAYTQKSGRTIYARDAKGHLHAALFVIWSPEGAYDLISTIDPEFRNSGAASLLVQEIIRESSAHTNRFDFEGSMIEGVEASFRKFGAIQTPYHVLTKTPSRLLRAREAVTSVFGSGKR